MEQRTQIRVVRLSEIKENNYNVRLLKELAENFNYAVVMRDEDVEYNWAPVSVSLTLSYAKAVLRVAPDDYAIVELW